MNGYGTKLAGPGIWFALAALLFAAIGLSVGTAYFSKLDMQPNEKREWAQLIVSILGFAGAITAFGFAVFQYMRAEKWKRIEFIANEINDFESDPVIQNALLMIDWGTRQINLFNVSDPKNKDFVKITREIQWKALLPHPLKKKYPEYQTFVSSEEELQDKDYHKKTFTFQEAKIRDTYDALLTRLDRFDNFIKAGLITADELKAFIIYWVNAITENEHQEDVAWRFTLLAYINFYNYSGVKHLLKCYGKDISAAGPICKTFKDSLEDKDLAERLSGSFKS